MLIPMAELDYAYLADYVALQDGKLTAVGASFTFVQVESLPSVMDLGIGGRVRAKEPECPVAMDITVLGPADRYEMSYGGHLNPGPMHRPYGDGTVGLLFALNLQVPLDTTGLYEIRISIEGRQVRRLAFEVETRQP